MATNRAQTALERIAGRDPWRAALEGDYAATAQRLQAAYRRLLPDLQDRLALLIARMEAGDPLTAEEVRGTREFRDLLRRIDAEMSGFGRLALNEAGVLSDGAVGHGLDAAFGMARLQVRDPRLLAGAWLTPDGAALAQLVAYADGAPMQARMAAFGEQAAQTFSDTLLAMTAQGKNPRAIARAMSNWWGLPYAWAETTTRTAQLWSYRVATHASYRANPRVIEGWLWNAALDLRTCLSCVSQHGSLHDLNETLNDHHRGRCSPVPVVRGTTWAQDVERGPDWFARQPPEAQRQMTGTSLFEAWRQGRVDWRDLSQPYHDDVYGDMLRQATNAELGIARLRR